jgi:alpha-galactosidase
MRNIKYLLLVPLLIFPAMAKGQLSDSIEIKSGGLKIEFGVYESKHLRLLNILPESFPSQSMPEQMHREAGYDVFLHCTGENRSIHHGDPGLRLEFINMEEKELPGGRLVILRQKDPVKNLIVESYYELNDQSPVVRRYTKVKNEGQEAVGIEYLSSAMLYNYNNCPGVVEDNILIHYAHNNWMQEAQWKQAKPSQLGWNTNDDQFRGKVSFHSTGSFSTATYLPMGMIENTSTSLTWFWQIEHNGSWYWEIADTYDKNTYLYLGGPDEVNGHAWKQLKPGESYQTVPVALGCVEGGFDEAVAALTRYRRQIIRPHPGTTNCPVIFNDYMNCLWADPSSENEMPLIETAATLGVDYFVIDAGWYAEKGESWWTNLGLWEPSKTRFQGGLKQLIEDIRARGMHPGLWLEIEVAGVNSPLKEKPDDWFFMRHGERVIDNGRFLLDFRNPDVIDYVSSVVDRLVSDFGIRYFKIDYNSWERIGPEGDESSLGQGLLEHNRAVIRWYKSILDRHPDLMIEACASGGNRLDYAILSQAQLASSTDQDDYKKYPAVVTGSLAAILPEQLGAWSYPLPEGDAREASFNMVNGMLCRLYQSGLIDQLSEESLEQVRQGIAIYKKQLAPFIPGAHPFFPLGMPDLSDTISPVSVGLKDKDKAYIAVWRLEGDDSVELPLPPEAKSARLLYPSGLGIEITQRGKLLQISFPDTWMACIAEVSLE